MENSPLANVQVAICDIDGIFRGKWVAAEKLQNLLTTGFGFCNVVFGWDSQDQCYDSAHLSNAENGFRDGHVTIDKESKRKIPWLDNQFFFIGDFSEDPNLSGICPRTLLRQIAQKARIKGYRPKFAAEYEWFNFRQDHEDPSKAIPLSEGMYGYSLVRLSENQNFIRTLTDQLREASVEIEGIHTETGPGVYEAAIRYTDVLQAADHAALLKYGIKSIASEFGISPCFMAKWSNDYPGCGGHIHQSLEDQKGQNLFSDTARPYGLSELGEHYLAGVIHCLPEMMAIYAPTVNSYKRYLGGAWSPRNATWGIENRTSALRLINASRYATRIENRVPGADANPYLAMAASLGAGLYGIEHQLELTDMSIGDALKNTKATLLSMSLHEATNIMEQSDKVREILGDEFVDHYTMTRRWEWKEFQKSVTDWEWKRYRHII